MTTLPFDGRVTCSDHGSRLPGYIACVHVLAGAPVTHYVEAESGELGEALCVTCKEEMDVGNAMRDSDPTFEPNLDQVRLVCSACLTRVMGPWRG